jgi:hydrogenase-4 component F
MTVILLTLSIPIFLSLGCAQAGRSRIGALHAIGYGALLAAGAAVFYRSSFLGQQLTCGGGLLLVDALSALFIVMISALAFAASLYSIKYIEHDIEKGIISAAKSRLYYLLFDLFIFSMLFVVSVNNLGYMWIAIEMTTLVSAFLVGFYRTKESVEAAWKYLIICTVGIALALIGVILFYHAASLAGAVGSLNWTNLSDCAKKLDPSIVKIAFIFILVGYGTKAGIAPMHTWLPDAHSQAVSPVSALLSGVLLKTALYAIIRFGMISSQALGGYSYFGNLMMLFGLFSLAVSAGFIIVQKDIKRLLAYSSIEHIGIICVGLGIGGKLGMFGALFHSFNHAMTKSLMFFGAGRIVSHYGRRNMNALRGVIAAMPFTGIVSLLGAFALAGFPPFSIFVSELMIVFAGIRSGRYAAVALTLLFLAVIFAATIYQFSRMMFGHKPKEIQAVGESFGTKAAFLFLLIFIVGLGVAAPFVIEKGIRAAVAVLLGG